MSETASCIEARPDVLFLPQSLLNLVTSSSHRLTCVENHLLAYVLINIFSHKYHRRNTLKTNIRKSDYIRLDLLSSRTYLISLNNKNNVLGVLLYPLYTKNAA